jgi:hypothetical protein
VYGKTSSKTVGEMRAKQGILIQEIEHPKWRVSLDIGIDASLSSEIDGPVWVRIRPRDRRGLLALARKRFIGHF